MTDEVAKFLYDMLEACQQISEFCSGRDEQSFVSDPVLVAAVERKLTIVGEALYGTRRYEPRWQELVSSADDIVRLRHILVHHYEEIDVRRLWQIVINDVPVLAGELRALLATAGPIDESE